MTRFVLASELTYLCVLCSNRPLMRIIMHLRTSCCIELKGIRTARVMESIAQRPNLAQTLLPTSISNTQLGHPDHALADPWFKNVTHSIAPFGSTAYCSASL